MSHSNGHSISNGYLNGENRLTWSSPLGAGPTLVKLGGAAIDRADDHPLLFEALCDLHRHARSEGGGVVLIHGGGAAVDRRLEQRGFVSERRDGIRITPPEHVDEVVAGLAGSVNKELVGRINRCGVPAVGLCLGDGNIAECAPATGYAFDPGRVGEVRGGDSRLIDLLLGAGFMPVLSSIGLDADGKALNINADDAAGALAGVLNCREMILLTDVPGVLDAHGVIIQELSADETKQRIESGEISGGMIPKVRGALKAAQESRAPVVITSWTDPSSLKALARGERTGTRVLPPTRSEPLEIVFAATPWSDLL